MLWLVGKKCGLDCFRVLSRRVSARGRACPSRSDANVEGKVREETGMFTQQTHIVYCKDMTIY